MIYVYRGINRTKREVYHGVSSDPVARRDGFHCQGGTVALRHWDCSKDQIIWRLVSHHYKLNLASEAAHAHEHNYRHHLGFRNIQTGGT